MCPIGWRWARFAAFLKDADKVATFHAIAWNVLKLAIISDTTDPQLIVCWPNEGQATGGGEIMVTIFGTRYGACWSQCVMSSGGAAAPTQQVHATRSTNYLWSP
jgi:hypothetical protein